jgi:hypothetical protein
LREYQDSTIRPVGGQDAVSPRGSTGTALVSTKIKAWLNDYLETRKL